MGLGFLLIGPSYIWNIQENIWVMLTGISILGFSASFAIIPLMPIIMNEIKEKFQHKQTNYINTASSLYNSAFGLGSILGPILGAHLSYYFEFRICTDILSHFSGFIFLILLVTAYWYKLYSFFKSKLGSRHVVLRETPNGRISIDSTSSNDRTNDAVQNENNIKQENI